MSIIRHDGGDRLDDRVNGCGYRYGRSNAGGGRGIASADTGDARRLPRRRLGLGIGLALLLASIALATPSKAVESAEAAGAGPAIPG